MAIQIFMLKDVPEDEVADVCGLLEKNRIDYYETPPGKWGVSVHALWINNDEDLVKARTLIDEYEAERAIILRNEFAERVQSGQQQTLLGRLIAEPLKTIAYLVIIFIVLYFSLNPFLSLGG